MSKSICLLAAMSALVAPVMSVASVSVETTNRGSIGNFDTGSAFFNQFTLGFTPEYHVWAFGVPVDDVPLRFEVARNYHIFDLSSLSGTATSATISFFHPDGAVGTTSYNSPDPTETMTLYEVTTDSSVIESQPGAFEPIFNDLGDGTVFGELTASSANDGAYQTITLNAAALAAIQDAIDNDTDWVVGGALSTIQFDPDLLPGGNPLENERIFRGSAGESSPTILTIEGVVPEPSSLALLGLGGLLLARRRRNG
ncbi:MAG: PEP-CTERM sorting domain-containing protein [Planctomycetota bacterium]